MATITDILKFILLELGVGQQITNTNNNFLRAENAIGGVLSKSVAGGSDVTLTDEEYFHKILIFTGVLTGNISVIVPDNTFEFLVFNNTTGSFTLTVKVTGQTGVAVTQTEHMLLYNNGTDVIDPSIGGGAGSIPNDSITYAKIQNISAASRSLGRGSAAGGGDPQELSYIAPLSVSGTDIVVAAASTSAAGVSELATNTELNTGTSTTLSIPPDSLSHSNYGTVVIGILVSDPLGTSITTGDGKAYVRIPSIANGFNLIAVSAHVSTVSSSGAITVQIRNVTDSVDMLSTALTIDASEKDSLTAATPAVINTSNDDVATGDEIEIDIDSSGTGAKGLFVELQFRLP